MLNIDKVKLVYLVCGVTDLRKSIRYLPSTLKCSKILKGKIL